MIVARLTGSDHASAIVAGVTYAAVGSAPVLRLCRALVAAGIDPETAMACYRADVLALRVRSIGEAALLIIRDNPPGFRRAAEPVAASPVRFSEAGATELPPAEQRTSEAA